MPTTTTIPSKKTKALALAETTTAAPEHIIRPVALRAMSMPPAYLEPSAWLEHIPFAFWLIEAHRPRQVVELGTHRGVSYFAFCQAVERLGLDTRCFGVDTWKGDEQAGFYGEEVFEKVNAYNNMQYSGFSRLVRSTFDDALKHFSDGTIDLLHIDGLHTLEAVRHDFESWLPKLSERAVVVLHDTNVRERNFGVFKLFEDLRERYPHFEFDHAHGLGVLGIGDEQSEYLRRLFEAQGDGFTRRTIHDVFSRLGRACADSFLVGKRQEKNRDLEKSVVEHKSKSERLQKRLDSVNEQLKQRSTELVSIQSQFQKRSEQQAVERGRLTERVELLTVRNTELTEEVQHRRVQVNELRVALEEQGRALESSQKRNDEDAHRLTELQEERNRLLARLEEGEAALREATDTVARYRRSEEERERKVTKIMEETSRLQDENSRLKRDIETRFDEIAKLTRMLLDAEETSGALENQLRSREARAGKLLAEIARLDRVVEMLACQTRSRAARESNARTLEVLQVADRPALIDIAVWGENEVPVELMLFGDLDESRFAAASLTATAFDARGAVLPGTRWLESDASDAALSVPRPPGRRGWFSRRAEPSASSRVIGASLEGDRFSGRLWVPVGATRVCLECRRRVEETKLLLVRGETLLSDCPVKPNEKLDLSFNVRSGRPLQRALTLVPQFLDANDKLISPPYDGFLSDDRRPAFGQLAGARRGRHNTLQTTAPPAAARLRLLIHPALARGQLEIVEVRGHEQPEPVWSMVKTPTKKGKVAVSLLLLAPRSEPQAARLVPTFYTADGTEIVGPCDGFESSERFPAFRHLAAGPTGVRTDLALNAPPGTRKCKLQVVPGKLTFGLRVEVGQSAEEAVHLDGNLLPAEGIALERDFSSNVKLCFKLRATAARDLKAAGVCEVAYVDSTGATLPVPCPGLNTPDALTAVLPFGASRRPTGRVTAVQLEPPPGAAKARLHFVPNDTNDALCIRIEPMPNANSIVRPLR